MSLLNPTGTSNSRQSNDIMGSKQLTKVEIDRRVDESKNSEFHHKRNLRAHSRLQVLSKG